MTAPTSPTEMKPAKSRTMIYAAVAIIIIIIIGAAVYIRFYGGSSTFTPTKIIHLSGSATAGWNGTLNTLSLTVNKSDNVRIILLSTDGSLHNFVIAYSGNAPSGAPPSADLVSPNFMSSSIPLSFDISSSQLQVGTFKFYCQYHFNTGMVGTIIIKNA